MSLILQKKTSLLLFLNLSEQRTSIVLGPNPDKSLYHMHYIDNFFSTHPLVPKFCVLTRFQDWCVTPWGDSAFPK